MGCDCSCSRCVTVSALREAREQRDAALKQERFAWERHAEKDRAYGDALRDRDAARAEVARLRELLEVAHSWAVTPHVGMCDVGNFDRDMASVCAALDAAKVRP